MKKQKFLAALLFAAVTMIGLTACDNGDDPVGPDPEPTEDVLAGSITESLKLDAAKTYTISGSVLVEEGATLTIPAGTTLKAKVGFSNYILVLQGGKINVEGTAEKPVTMTIIDGAKADERWGGLIINGRAPLEGPVDGKDLVGDTEISTNYRYGGDQTGDSSGSITFLKLLYTGAKSNKDTEHNGLTLNGVGNGTKIENIFVKDGSDDGIEFFGGSVNVTNLLVVNSDDDMFDFTRGYNGKLTNAYGIWEAGFSTSESDPSGVEADGNLDGDYPDATNQSNFTIENMTIDFKQAYDKNVANKKFAQSGIRARRKVTINVVNGLIKGTGYVQTLVNLEGGELGGANEASNISVTNALTTAPDLPWKYNSGLSETDYPNANKFAPSNTGCAASNFAWTGYQF